MKKLFLPMALLMMSFAQSQDRDKKFATYTTTDPFAYSDGFNIGAGVEYQMNYIYVGAQAFTFPNLNDVTYNHLIGSVGFNLHSWDSRWRGYIGGRAGFIFRKGGHALMGIEAGIDYKVLRSNWFTGIGASRDMRGDSKLWSNDEYFIVNSGFVRIGLMF